MHHQPTVRLRGTPTAGLRRQSVWPALLVGTGDLYSRHAPVPTHANTLVDSAAGLEWDRDVLGKPRVVGPAGDRGAIEVQA